MSDIKRCNACQQVKLKTDFDRHPQNRDGRQGTCRTCQAEAAPLRRHGLTRLEKAQIAEQQGGCLICHTMNPGTKGWVVDHDHRCCGPIRSCPNCRRGILCGRCNTALGMAADDPQILRRLADYRDAHRVGQADRSTDQSTDQSTDSLSAIVLTDGRDGLTKNSLQTVDQSFRSVPRARIPDDHEFAARKAALRASHPTTPTGTTPQQATR